MPTRRHTVSTYTIHFGGRPSWSVVAQVNCRNAEEDWVAMIRFYRNGGSIPDHSLSVDRINLNFSESLLDAILTTLREEEPISVYINSDTAIGYLSTAEEEPVGEDEGA